MNHELPNYPDAQETAVELTAENQFDTVENSERESRKERLGKKLWKAANTLLFVGSITSIATSNKEVVQAIGQGINYAAENTGPWGPTLMVTGGAIAVGSSMLRKRRAREQAEQSPQEIQQ